MCERVVMRAYVIRIACNQQPAYVYVNIKHCELSIPWLVCIQFIQKHKMKRPTDQSHIACARANELTAHEGERERKEHTFTCTHTHRGMNRTY